MPTVPNISVYAPGEDITAVATTPVVAQRFVGISGNRVNGNVAVAPAAAAGRIFGVAATDAPVNGLVRVARGAGRVVRVTATGAIAAFAEVQVGANGTATALAAGKAVGYAITAAVDTGEAQISLYA
ncbi:hypothetical protein ASG82_16435 [Mycobacterium sp. Soil538]|nr:hypothetical protein ASG82_16435 [Mycobacterium sp. Soil538]